MRGEKRSDNPCFYHVPGSSPHARGKGANINDVGKVFRIIPACAGKRPFRKREYPLPQDHPRMRGEKKLETS